jgi:glycosyltransferase involved in cell wall biosynthesis
MNLRLDVQDFQRSQDTLRRVHLIVVVPCYNEAERLPAKEFRDFALPGHRIEFLFVNDGSTDTTAQMLADNKFDTLDLEQNRGKAEAVRAGMLAALVRQPDAIAFWDADLATPLSQIPLFVDILTSRPEIELVFAARVRLLGREISRNPARHYFGRVGATLISSTLGLAIYDTQCGAKMFRVNETTPRLFDKPFISRWIFDVEIVARFVEARGRDGAARAIYELPIMVWRDVKGSKVGAADFAHALKDLWKIRRAYSRHPERERRISR